MLPRNHPDRIKIAFDDHRLMANAGLILPATLAQHLGLGELVDNHVDLGCQGRADNRPLGRRESVPLGSQVVSNNVRSE